MKKLRIIPLIFLTGLMLLTFACKENFDHSYVPGNYLNYNCKSNNGYVEFSDAAIKKFSYYHYKIGELLDTNPSGIMFNTVDSFSVFFDTSNIEYYNPNSNYWNLTDRSIISYNSIFEGMGQSEYHKIFVCKNDQQKKILINCQYELTGEMAGSGLQSFAFGYLISVPKKYKDYEVLYRLNKTD